MRSVMLTGATGFIGSHIAERLLRNGIHTNLFVRRRTDLIDSLEKMGAAVYIAQSDPINMLKESLKHTDVVIHCAGATKALNETDYIKANVDFTENILRLTNKQKFVYLSSQAAAGPSDSLIPSNEQAEPNPVSYYGKSKLLAEAGIKEWGKANNNNYVILRPCIVYGPRERDVYHSFRLIKKGIFFCLGSGKQRFSFIHVDDLVNAVMTCAGDTPLGETYFVSHDQACSWEDLSRAIQNALNKTRILVLKIPEIMAYFAACLFDTLSLATQKPYIINRQKIIEARQPAWVCSNNKIKGELPWKPEISLEKGIKQTADWYAVENWI